MIHGIRHWGQIAMALRQACFVSDWSHDMMYLAGAALTFASKKNEPAI